jgi:argininosuccinate lyase
MRSVHPARNCLMLCLCWAALAATAQGRQDASRDEFYWLGEFNKAAAVMTTEQGIIPRTLAGPLARGVAKVIEEGDKPGGKRPRDYLQYETLVIAHAGPDASRLHSGRSRQDILATTRRAMLRDRTLELIDALDAMRDRLHGFAAQHVATIVPAYTNGVQAQPTTYAHYLGGFAAAFERDAQRLREAYARLNLSPLGTAVLGTSSFPVDRKRLAELLGFNGLVENSFDATQLSTLDTGVELDSIAANLALTIGAFVQDVHTQYHQVEPWLLLREGALTGTSSIMPQKRNPNALNQVRLQASTVVGGAALFMIQSHNVPPGMPDYKREQSQKTIEDATQMVKQFGQLLDGIVVNTERALAEVNAEYSTTTELADVLQREADVPFRAGHHFASELVTFGRANKLKPADLKFADVKRIYAESIRHFNLPSSGELPLSEARFRESLSAQGMIAASKGIGGPQESEVRRLQAQSKERLAKDRAWSKATKQHLADAQSKLNSEFGKLAEIK